MIPPHWIFSLNLVINWKLCHISFTRSHVRLTSLDVAWFSSSAPWQMMGKTHDQIKQEEEITNAGGFCNACMTHWQVQLENPCDIHLYSRGSSRVIVGPKSNILQGFGKRWGFGGEWGNDSWPSVLAPPPRGRSKLLCIPFCEMRSNKHSLYSLLIVIGKQHKIEEAIKSLGVV